MLVEIRPARHAEPDFTTMPSPHSSLKNLVPAGLRRAYRNLKLVLTADMEFTLRRLAYDEQNIRGLAGLVLRTAYPALCAPNASKSPINAHEGKLYSQYDEDGILLHIFSTIGVKNRQFVEFGVSDGRENQSAMFALIFGWSGLVMEADQRTYERARSFYDSLLPGPASKRVNLVKEMVTPDNINQILETNHITGEIDLLSIDIDSNDYWVWKAITAIQPRVVVIEYNGALGNTDPITIPYTPDFDRFKMHNAGYYYGTSMKAAVKLGETKGYTFVGCESSGGVNAFFIRKDVAEGKFSAESPDEAFYPQMRRFKSQTVEEQFAQIKDLPFERV